MESQNRLRNGTDSLFAICDAVDILSGLDGAYADAHIGEMIYALGSLYTLETSDVEEDYRDFLLELKSIIAEELEIDLGARIEDFDGSARGDVLYV